jgi:hypothetical protein
VVEVRASREERKEAVAFAGAAGERVVSFHPLETHSLQGE